MIHQTNFQSPLNFEFRVDRFPNLNLYVQGVNLPSINLASVDVPTPFTKIPFGGDHLHFGELQIEFAIDEVWTGWFEFYSWMVGLAFPEKFKQYLTLKKGEEVDLDGNPRKNHAAVPPGMGHVGTQATLTALNSHKIPFIEFTFVDLVPTSLGELRFSTMESDIRFLTTTANFKYNYYTAKKVT